MTRPIFSLILLVLATVTVVLAAATGSTAWVIIGVCFVVFSTGQLWRWYNWPRRLRR